MNVGKLSEPVYILKPENGYYQSAEKAAALAYCKVEKTGKDTIFSHNAAKLPEVVFKLHKHRAMSEKSALMWRGEHYLVYDVADNRDGYQTVSAVKMQLHQWQGNHTSFDGFVAEKYMNAPFDEYHAEEEECNILIVEPDVKLGLSEVLHREDGAAWVVRKRYTASPSRNEYEVVYYGNID